VIYLESNQIYLTKTNDDANSWPAPQDRISGGAR